MVVSRHHHTPSTNFSQKSLLLLLLFFVRFEIHSSASFLLPPPLTNSKLQYICIYLYLWYQTERWIQLSHVSFQGLAPPPFLLPSRRSITKPRLTTFFRPFVIRRQQHVFNLDDSFVSNSSWGIIIITVDFCFVQFSQDSLPNAWRCRVARFW